MPSIKFFGAWGNWSFLCQFLGSLSLGFPHRAFCPASVKLIVFTTLFLIWYFFWPPSFLSPVSFLVQNYFPPRKRHTISVVSRECHSTKDIQKDFSNSLHVFLFEDFRFVEMPLALLHLWRNKAFLNITADTLTLWNITWTERFHHKTHQPLRTTSAPFSSAFLTPSSVLSRNGPT